MQAKNQGKAETEKGSSEELEITKAKQVSLKTKSEIFHALVFQIIVYRCESWTVKKADRKNKMIHLRWRRALWIPWAARKMNKWVLEQIKADTLLGAKMTKLILSHFEHTMQRQGSLEKIMLGKTEGGKERGRPIMR